MQMDIQHLWVGCDSIGISAARESALRLGLLQFPFALAWAYYRLRPFARWEELRRPWRHIRPLRAALGRPPLTRRAGRA